MIDIEELQSDLEYGLYCSSNQECCDEDMGIADAIIAQMMGWAIEENLT